MCGLVGFWAPGRYATLKELLAKSAEQLTHRGPDDAGMYLAPDEGIGLAHRRLSIIDLSTAGRQPMASDDGRVQIVYNGEVYNYRELRTILEDKGHRFFSHTDTEVVLKAYLQWGIRCLDRFVGMFALAVWDRNRRQCYLARDRLGIKPLYYYFKNDTLVFASELKALTAFHCLELNVDSDALGLFLHYQYIPAPRTIYEEVCKLMPGSFLVCDGNTIRCESYWKLPNEPGENSRSILSEEEALEKLAELLKSAVSCRLISDVPLGALLSGGIDSSLVVSLMQEVHGSQIKTFSIGFAESEYDEAPDAAMIAGHLGTDHTEMYVSAEDALAIIPKLAEIYDEPFGDSSGVATFLVCLMAHSQLTVALSGDGGDEQFGGYVRYGATESMSAILERVPVFARNIFARFLASIPLSLVSRCYLPLREQLPESLRFANFEDKWEKWIRQIPKTDLAEIYRAAICIFPKTDLKRLMGRCPPPGLFETLFEKSWKMTSKNRLMRVDQGTYLPDAMLTKIDRASMAVGLEVRVPLLDHRVVDFSSSLPERLKYNEKTGKFLLKKLLERYFPKQMTARPKKGFAVPIAIWLRGALKPMMLDYLSTSRLKAEGRFETNYVEKMIAEHLSGRANHQHRLWCLLMWEMWRERWR